MSKVQPKQEKCKITEQELYERFCQADKNGNGYLSADQITILLQNLGCQDIYKGTIRKICRNLNKQKKLKDPNYIKSQQNFSESSQIFASKFIKNKQILSERSQSAASERSITSNVSVSKKETFQEKLLRKQEKRKKQEQQASINFQEFKKYFYILQKPLGKLIYNLSLQRSVAVAAASRKIKGLKIFQKDRGQKIKMNLLVGQKKLSYNSSIDFKIEKIQKSKKNDEKFFIELALMSNSEENAATIVKHLKGLAEILIGVIVTQHQEQLGEINDILNIQEIIEGNVGKIRITIIDEQVKKFLSDFINTFDEILGTEIGLVIKVVYQFNFLLSQIINNPQAMIEDMFVKDCNIKIQYLGSQFLDSVKELALSQNFFELLRLEFDPALLSIFGFLSMEKANLFLKFKNIQRDTVSHGLTRQIVEILGTLRQLQSEQFSLKVLSQIVTGPIKVKAQISELKVDVNINVTDILKLIYMMQGHPSQSDYQSD